MITIRGDQLRPGIIEDIHIKDKLSESVLNINWSGHGSEMLSSKKVLDYIQVDNLTFSAAALDVTAQITAPPVTSGSTDEGVPSDAPYNKVIIRDHATGEPVLDADGKQVFGRLTFDSTTSKWTLTLQTTDAGGTEVDFIPSGALVVDVQYLRRFNLNTVAELFAANEKWVDGAADVTAHLNIEQLAKDLYGASFSLDRDGQANRDISVGDELAQARNSTIYGSKASLKDRLDAAETEIHAARGSKADLNTRITELETSVNTRTSNLEAAVHTHHRTVIHPIDGQTQVDMPAGHTYVAGSDTLEVYLNGLLLIAGEDYTEDAGGTFVTMNVALQAADRVILKWTEAAV